MLDLFYRLFLITALLSHYVSYDPTHPSHISEAKVGTTAEIYEFRDPPETSNEVGLRLKVRGNQRFRLLSSRVQIDG